MTTKGLEADIRDLVAGDDVDPDAAQPDLDLFADMPSPIERQAEFKGVGRGPGRPAGSSNRSSLDLVRYIKATRRPALLALQDVADMSWSDLATAMGCKLPEAAEFWRKCVAELLPYVERRQPQALELAGAVGLPVVVWQSDPVRADLVNGNPPEDGEAIDAEFTPIASTVDARTGEVSRLKSHADDEPEGPQGFEDD